MNQFTSGFKTTEKNLVIFSPIVSEEIMKVKLWMNELFGNKYTHLPHLTLLLLPFDTVNVNYKNFDKDIVKFFENKSPIKIFSKGMAKDSIREFYKLSFEGSELANLHSELLKIGQRYRNGVFREKDVTKYFDNYFKPAEWDSTLKYGFHRAGEYFDPHVTLGEVEFSNGWTQEMILDEIAKNISSNINMDLELNEFHILVGKEDGTELEYEKIIKL